MIVGCPKELKNGETRVAITPVGASELVRAGHSVLVETGAGEGSGFSDEDYRCRGADVVQWATGLWARADLVVKVKEPEPSEYDHLREGLILFAFLHLAPNRTLTEILLRAGVTALAYETVRLPSGELPLLSPMSEIAGRMSVISGAYYLGYQQGGSGCLVSGAPGALPASVVIVGGGTVGLNAAKMAAGLGSRVTILDIDGARMRHLSDVLPANCVTLFSDPAALERSLATADLLIGALLVRGAVAPKVVTKDLMRTMPFRSVAVDVAVDQGGCFETTRPTTHQSPVYTEDGVVHYAVLNMPAAYPRTATAALTNATLPYILEIADKGIIKAVQDHVSLREGVNTWQGRLTCSAVAESQQVECHPLWD